MFVTVKGTVVFIEDKTIKGEKGQADQHYRLVTIMGGGPGKKPELDAVKVYNGMKVEMGQKVELPVEVTAYMKKDRDGRATGAALTVKVAE
jgi:hypothetical protein